jgi:ferredoxin
MADRNERVPQNVPGRFFVDTSCIFCELCELTAPSVFKEDQENGWAYVYHQPESKEELAAASEALEGCPTESIGADSYNPEWRAPLGPRSDEKTA